MCESVLSSNNLILMFTIFVKIPCSILFGAIIFLVHDSTFRRMESPLYESYYIHTEKSSNNILLSFHILNAFSQFINSAYS
mmetsp:Transcript_49983/g.102908  ORF Transcript_49983/g.102908 Transcript_49983/m.102908 type:complete len:81 (-) Transcript_49983:986-1228(-)